MMYKNSYSSQPRNIQQLKKDIDSFPCVTKREIENAINTMKYGKAPGADNIIRQICSQPASKIIKFQKTGTTQS